MQKKLSDYFEALSGSDVLSDFYEEWALLRCEEAVVVGGMLLGINVVDCNLCVKEEDLDAHQGLIDFSLYLRNSSSTSCDNDDVTDANDESITAVLDQKNYIEEMNRHLE
jgi:hypothetical protein